MHTPISNLIRDKISKYKILRGSVFIDHRIKALEELLPQIEAIEKDSVENLLNEMPRNVVLSRMLDGTNDWHASSVDFIEDSSIN